MTCYVLAWFQASYQIGLLPNWDFVHGPNLLSTYSLGCTLRPDTISPYSLGTAPWGLSCVGQDIDTPLLSDTALSDRNRLNQTDHGLQTTDTIVRAGHELVCLVLGWDPSTACALLEFAEAPTRILRLLYTVDIGITTTTSPALDVAALCLVSWPAAILTQILTSDPCQRLHVSLQQTHHCNMILRLRAACHCIMA